MEDWIGDCGGVGFVRLENEEEALVICSGESSEGGYFLERLVVLNVRELKSSDEGCKALSAKSKSWSTLLSHE